MPTGKHERYASVDAVRQRTREQLLEQRELALDSRSDASDSDSTIVSTSGSSTSGDGAMQQNQFQQAFLVGEHAWCSANIAALNMQEY